MTALWLVFGIGGWLVALVVSIGAARARRRVLQQALDLRVHVRPYLQRRAFDAVVQVPESPEATAGAIVEDLCRIADRLVEHERSVSATSDLASMLGVSDTQPMTPEQPMTRRPAGSGTGGQ